MSMPDARDPLWVAAPHSRRNAAGAVKVGFAMNPFDAPLDPAVEAAMTRALDGLRAAGMTVQEVAPPQAATLPALWGKLMFTETEALLRKTLEATASPEMQSYYHAFVDLFEPTDTEGLLRALQARVVAQRAWAQMFEQVDVLLLPTSLSRPFANDLDFKAPDQLPAIVAAQAPLFAVNVLGLPSAALPTHLEGRTPLGIQLVGPMHEDAFILDVAERLERALGTVWKSLAIPG
jgi:amidase